MPAVAVKPPFALVLREDEEAESPRISNDCFGKMVCFHDRYNLGDKHDYSAPEDFLRDLVRETVSAKDICDFTIAEKSPDVELKYNQLDGDWVVIARYHKEWEEAASFKNPLTGQEETVSDVLLEYMGTASLLRLAEYENVILPLYLYDHSGLSMSTASYAGRAQHAEWDSGAVGWIYVTKADATAALGETDIGVFSITTEMLETEVAEYDSYLRGECYGFELYEAGEMSNSCWGFIGDLSELRPDIESHLPEGCKGIMDNIVYLNSDRELDGVLMESAATPIYMEGDSFMSNQEQSTGAVKLDARAYPFEEPKGKQLAFASVTINGCFAVNGIKIMDGGEKGPFVAMPSTKDKEGNYKDICFPTTKELRAELSATVMDAYNAAVEKGLADRAADRGAPEQEKPSAVDKLNEAKKEAKAQAKAPKPEKSAPKKSDPSI